MSFEEPQNKKKDKIEIPIWHKQNLTFAEAVAYSNIGENRLDMLLRDPKCNFLLKVGSKRLIKRKQFDEFIENTSII